MKNFLLLLLLIVIAVYAYVAVELRGDLNSHFNQTTRFKLGQYGLARSIWNLHNDGDARAEYLKGQDPIVMEIVKAPGIDIPEAILNNLRQKLSKLLGRDIQFYNVDSIQKGELKAEDIDNIIKTKRRHILPGQPNLFVILADNYTSEKNEIGSTVKEFGIIISYNNIQELTKSHFSSTDQYLESTILHEVGHQLGLPHNQESDCIMDERVNHPDSAGYFSGEYTPTQFCDMEIKQLAAIKASVQ